MRHFEIDFVSDVSCPWCVIGLRGLQTALERLAPDINASIHFKPFELNPGMSKEGQDITEHLIQKYGGTPEQLQQSREAIRARGAALGFHFDLGARARIYNTFDAHRLLHWAELEGKQVALKQALFQRYFSEGGNPSDADTLVDVCNSVGLDPARARSILESEEYAAEVRAQLDFYRQAGINSVPAIIIDNQHLIQGGQPPEWFEHALRDLAQRPA